MSKEDLKKKERVDLVVGQEAQQAGQTAGQKEGTTSDANNVGAVEDENADDDLSQEVLFSSSEDTGFIDSDSTGILDRSAFSAKPLSDDGIIGQTIAGRFEIISKLGEGGMSVVYKARHLMLDRIVAVKLIQPGQMLSKAAMRFQQEAKAATALNHNNIATVREFGYDENGAYLVMDYIDGISLEAAIKQSGTFTPERTRNIITQVCDGLKHAHEAGVIHRDLKPANIILTTHADGIEVPKIVDFGIAKLVDEEKASNLTQTGEVFGTPNYMSPEQCLGKHADKRSDIYSLGCVTYECLTGAPPFVSDSALETLMKHVNDQFQPINKKVPAYMLSAVQGCLEKSPDDRWQSTQDLKDFLLDPNGPAQKKYKKIRKHLSKSQVAKICIVACLVSAFVAALTTAWPLIQRVIAPTPWQTLGMQAGGEIINGPPNYSHAKTLLKQAIEAAKRGNAPDMDMELLNTQLAHLLSNMNNTAESKKYFAIALQYNEKHGENFARGSIHDWVAQLYLNEKNFQKAADEAKTAIEIKTRTIGERHRLTLLSFFRLGQAYEGLGNYDEAEKIDKKIIEIANALYPSQNDALVGDAYEQMGDVLFKLGRGPEAVENYKLSLPIYSKTIGNDSKKTMKTVAAVCKYLQNTGKAAEAQQIQKQYSVEQP